MDPVYRYSAADLPLALPKAYRYVDLDIDIMRRMGIEPSHPVMQRRVMLVPIMAVLSRLAFRVLEQALDETLYDESPATGRRAELSMTAYYEHGRAFDQCEIGFSRLDEGQLAEAIPDAVWTDVIETADWRPEPGSCEQIKSAGDILAWARYESGGSRRGFLELLRNMAEDAKETRRERNSLYRQAREEIDAGRRRLGGDV